MSRRTTAQHVDLGSQLFALRNSPSSPLQKCVERVEALKTAAQNLVIGHSFFCPTFQHPVNPDALRALELLVFEISIMNHFGDFPDRLVLNTEAANQRLECAAIAVMGELHVHHIEWKDLAIRGNCRGENKLRSRIDESSNQPG